jgi:hypothetical protein
VCLVIARINLGPADALSDMSRGVVVVAPHLGAGDAERAARMVLDAAGVEQQPGTGAWCRCGKPLPIPTESAALSA